MGGLFGEEIYGGECFFSFELCLFVIVELVGSSLLTFSDCVCSIRFAGIHVGTEIEENAEEKQRRRFGYDIEQHSNTEFVGFVAIPNCSRHLSYTGGHHEDVHGLYGL